MKPITLSLRLNVVFAAIIGLAFFASCGETNEPADLLLVREDAQPVEVAGHPLAPP